VVAHMGEHVLDDVKWQEPLHLYAAFYEQLLHR
jgi:hypothetical protein